MSGLQLAREYYQACLPILESSIPDIMEFAAAGLVGEGSECFGLDDCISRDHDFGPGFCLWLPDEFLLANQSRVKNALMTLPAIFIGQKCRELHGRLGALGIQGFYRNLTGLKAPPADWKQWLAIPENGLAHATNGEIFEDRAGIFSDWRSRLLEYYPEDVRLKKIAARVMTMAQTGQYNLPRSRERGDKVAAMLAQARFAEAAISFAYLLNKRYMP
ncbi:MAG: DUF4037 domain-containing protein, partial [Desulfovibrio sp.]|nr:DUF4037 domain-containing protein [Desulfovibrio sp.]